MGNLWVNKITVPGGVDSASESLHHPMFYFLLRFFWGRGNFSWRGRIFVIGGQKGWFYLRFWEVVRRGVT